MTTLHIWRTIDDDKPPSPIYTYNAQDFFTKLKRTSMEWNKYTDSDNSKAKKEDRGRIGFTKFENFLRQGKKRKLYIQQNGKQVWNF